MKTSNKNNNEPNGCAPISFTAVFDQPTDTQQRLLHKAGESIPFRALNKTENEKLQSDSFNPFSS